MKTDKRDKTLRFKVNKEEWNIIQERVKKCNVSSMSELFRQMMLHGMYLEYDRETLKKIQRDISGIANNINQIAHRVNSTGRVYQQDLNEVKSEVKKVWQLLLSIQSELQKLSQLNT